MQSAQAETILLEIRLFGNVEVRVCNEPIPPLHTRRSLWLLAILALKAGAPIERSVLAGRLWPDSSETTALHNLRQALADLRSALGLAGELIIAVSPRSIRLNVDRAEIDALTFDRACKNEDAHSLRRAAEIYTGELLEGCDEPWALQERGSRAEAYLSVLERLALLCRSQGDLGNCVQLLKLAAAADPYRESTHRDLIAALSEAGELAAAASVYHALRERFHRDLNALPDPDTTDAYNRIRRRATPNDVPEVRAVRSVRPRQLPTSVTSLIGREDAVREIVSLLVTHRLVSLTGIGGIGKTRLALRVAEEMQQRFEQRVAFVELASIADETAVPEAIREALGIPPAQGWSQTAESVAAHLSTARYLLALDNCEHLLSASAKIADSLLRQCPLLTIIVTSRHALGVHGERIWAVPPLAIATDAARSANRDRDQADTIPSAAAQLFVNRARAAAPGFRESDATVRAIQEICQQLDGIPLAIELAAARVRAMSVDQIQSRLSNGLDVLSKGGAALLPRHHTLEAAFEWSWELLTLDEQSVLQRLTVFAGGCALEAAEAVCGKAVGHPATVADLLTALVDKSLVVFSPGDDLRNDDARFQSEPRFRLLETVRQFAAKRLSRSGNESQARDLHCEFYAALAEKMRPRLLEPDQARWFMALESDHDNFRSAIAWSRSSPEGVKQEFRLVSALSRFWDTHGHLQEGYAYLRAALQRATDDIDPETVATVHVQAGWAAGAMSERSAARGHYESSIAYWRATNNLPKLAGALNNLGTILVHDDHFAVAREMLEESLSINRGLGAANFGSVLSSLGNLEARLGNLAAARARYEESAQHSERSGSLQQAGITLRNLCYLDLQEGNVEAAILRGSACLRKLRECGAIVNMPAALDQMAMVAQRRALYSVSARLFGAGNAIRVDLGMPQPGAEDRLAAIQAARNELGPQEFEFSYEEGMSMSADNAIDFALNSFRIP